VEPGGFRLAYNDYDNANDNSNLSGHLCYQISGSADLASWQKTTSESRALVPIDSNGEGDLKNKGMKRLGDLYQRVCSIKNLELADAKAGKGKGAQIGVQLHELNRHDNIVRLHEILISKRYKTSEYHVFKIYEPKERVIYKLPYYPDRIVHHAIMNQLETIFVSTFTADTYSCIKGRGVHKAGEALKRALRDVNGTEYCLQLDIRKFYPSIDHEILKGLVRRKIKDTDLLWLLDEIIDSADGLPIGNYLSQYLANYYLSGFDHWLKEVMGVRYYFRYADDMVILSGDKRYLHELRSHIETYLRDNLKLQLKPNWKVFPVAARGIDFIGYVFYHSHTLLRKSIKLRCRLMLKKNKNPSSIASYRGWMKHCNSRHLEKKLFNEEFQRSKHSNSTTTIHRKEN
jgi:RNA-directed DNA polymerase